MGKELEDKLREIVEQAQLEAAREWNSNTRPHPSRTLESRSEAVAQIIKAFEEAGYIQIPKLHASTGYVIKKGGEAITVKPSEVMTGQEFYDRFFYELGVATEKFHLTLVNNRSYAQLEEVLLLTREAARRAAGLE